MKRGSENGNMKGASRKKEWDVQGVSFSKGDNAIFATAGEYMRASLDIEDIENDPGLATARKEAAQIVSDHKNTTDNSERRNFIISSLADTGSSNADLNSTEDSEISALTAGWVEKHLAYKESGITDPKKEEIRNFIENSFADAGKKAATARRRSLVIRYSLLAAASVAGLFFLVRSLIPYDSASLYKSYYEPFKTISPITRGSENQAADEMSKAIEFYGQGNYSAAAALSAFALRKDSSSMDARFYLGLSSLAQGDLPLATRLLSVVSESIYVYSTEAEWYLGLAYMKAGNNDAARTCFIDLSRSEYYSGRCERILRRLK